MVENLNGLKQNGREVKRNGVKLNGNEVKVLVNRVCYIY